MRKYILIALVSLLLLSSCTLEIVDREKDAKLVTAQSEAAIAASNAARADENALLARAQRAELHALKIEELNAAKEERINAQKISIYAEEYKKVASKVLIVSVLVSLSLALSAFFFSSAFSYHKKAQLWATLIYPDARGFLPLQICATGGQYVYAINHATGAVYRLDAKKPEDRQMIKGVLELQQANNISRAARSLFGKDRDIATISPESTPPNMDKLTSDVYDVLEIEEAE